MEINMQTRKGLGRGFDSLLPPPTIKLEKENKGVNTVPIDSIAPNRLQPRTIFDDEKIRELANSIKEEGILQPLIVSPLPDGRYELIAGERRLRASRLAGLSEVPVIIKNADDTGMLALSLIENIQREDLNAIEESLAYQELVEKFGLTQEEIAKRVGKSRAAVANSLRLQKLPQVVKEDVACGRYSPGHARALLSAEGIHEQLKLREWIVKNTPTVRDVELKVGIIKGNSSKSKNNKELSPQISSIVNRIREKLGTKVKIVENRKGGGKLLIDYYSWQDLDRLYLLLTGG
jgi:ParB family chromosome partitioning protein